ncbi:MAG: hypothetical protein ACXWC0_21200, partial [Burkholderiales bacterium]
ERCCERRDKHVNLTARAPQLGRCHANSLTASTTASGHSSNFAKLKRRGRADETRCFGVRSDRDFFYGWRVREHV